VVSKRDFLDFLSPDLLFAGAAILGILTLLLVVLIFANMRQKKRLYFGRQKITEQLNNWISEALIEENGIHIEIPEWLQLYFREHAHRQYVVDSLININKNLTGSAAENITAIYEQLGLKQYAQQKLKSIRGHTKARGIYELYMMDRKEAMLEIAEYTDSDNDIVRIEAQIAMVGFMGFDGLAFLSKLTHPLNEWHQLQLLEQLEKLDVRELKELPLWLVSANDYVRLFALKLADIYQQFQVHDQVVRCLSSDDENIRSHAITTLGRIAREHTIEILKEVYDSETNNNKKNILKQIAAAGSEEDVQFLMEQLSNTDDSVVLEAGRAIVACSENGLEYLTFYAAGNSTLQSITNQIKYELKKR